MTNVAKIDPDKDPDRRFSHLPSFPRVHVVRHGTINTALATALDVFPLRPEDTAESHNVFRAFPRVSVGGASVKQVIVAVSRSTVVVPPTPHTPPGQGTPGGGR